MDLSRRRVLSAAALGGAAALVGATALGSLAPEAAFAAPSALDPDAPDPNFAEGRVTGVADTMLLVTGSDGTLWRIRVTSASSIWKLRPATLDQVSVGDGLYARGVRLPDGTLAADSVWVNIVNLQVHIAAITRNTVHMDHKGSRIVGHVVPGTSVAAYNGTPAVADLSLLKVGAHIQVLGAWIPDTNEIEIATVHAAA
ncbi:hypothetical protein Lfu02_03990 [Longispora fulva]|uniref:Cell wall protein n=1 Tax=Longispora fulva TaxID=619741 RepID=A0A8J7GPT2_9ACTN|nr:cell wall protein [Longispora fulva]MBG6135733.1 hypothetical protein [Longispora fulva]GIG56027.1 hypothetical protein Lfu02_03990 [Longispora fulva]